MSLITPTNEVNEEIIRVCRCCLSTNRNIYSIQDERIAEAYEQLIGYHMGPAYINEITSQLPYRQTDIKILSIDNDSITLDTLSHYHDSYDITETCFNDDINYDTQLSDATDLKIFTDNIKIGNTDARTVYKRKNKQKETYTKRRNITESVGNVFQNEIKQHTAEIVQKGDEKSHFVTKLSKVEIKRNIKKEIGKRKCFETKDNIEEFQKEYDVNIVILDREEQLKEFAERRSNFSYIHSPYQCKLCYKGYMDVNLLDKHMTAFHNPSRGYVCEVCSYRYRDKRALTQHHKKHRVKFFCKQCTLVSRTKFDAKAHYKSHCGKLHKCTHCNKSYEKLSSYLSHLRIHHPSNVAWCEFCGESFVGQFGLSVHKKKSHGNLSLPSQCTTCDMRFVSSDALATHERQSHDNRATSRNACAHCGAIFRESNELRQHLLDAHKSTKIYACEKCDKTFGGESQYSAHYKRMHVHSEGIAIRKLAKPWVCEVCGKSLSSKSSLRYHQRNHTGERPYQCSHCDKSFTLKRLLQSHLSVHSSARPYACKLCPKTFKGRSALRTHEQVHSCGKIKT